jgi:hypothetical protein
MFQVSILNLINFVGNYNIETLGTCQDLVLDGSMSFGNAFLEYHWNVHPLSPSQLETIRLKRTSYIFQNPSEVASIRVEMNSTISLCVDELEIYSINGTDNLALQATVVLDSPDNEFVAPNISIDYSVKNINDRSYQTQYYTLNDALY